MPLGIRWVRSAGSSKPSIDLADHELGAGDAPRRRRGRATTRRRGSCSARPAAPGRRAGRARWRGTWRRAWRRAASASVSAAQATCQSWAWTTSGRQSPSRAASCTRWWLAEATRATSSSSGSHGRSVRARSTRTPPTTLSAGRPGCASVNSTTSWPAAASAWLSPSTWAATPPTDRGGNSQVSIRTRIGAHPTAERRFRRTIRGHIRPVKSLQNRWRGGRLAAVMDRRRPAPLRPVVTAGAHAGRGRRRVRAWRSGSAPSPPAGRWPRPA